jgi:hypothetical protein
MIQNLGRKYMEERNRKREGKIILKRVLDNRT